MHRRIKYFTVRIQSWIIECAEANSCSDYYRVVALQGLKSALLMIEGKGTELILNNQVYNKIKLALSLML